MERDTRPGHCGHHPRSRAVAMIEYTNVRGRYRFSGVCERCLPRTKANPILAAHGHRVIEYDAGLRASGGLNGE